MKLEQTIIVLLIIVIMEFAVSLVILHNGEPGCKTDEEIIESKYRNNWDATRYWICKVRNEQAQSVKCPEEMLFYDLQKKCVMWYDWVWTEPIDPPSLPDTYQIN